MSTSPASVEYAARRNIPIIVGGPTAVMGQAPHVVRLWREKMEQFGHEHAHIDPPVSMNIYVAPTMEEAERDPLGLEDFSTKILAKIGSPIGADGTIPPGYEEWANRQRDRETVAEARRTSGIPALRDIPRTSSRSVWSRSRSWESTTYSAASASPDWPAKRQSAPSRCSHRT